MRAFTAIEKRKKKAQYLINLKKGGNKGRAAKQAGVCLRSIQYWCHDDKAFNSAEATAMQDYLDKNDSRAYRWKLASEV